MSNRTYLSIGDVLTLLREEFPDVTISKIRFLESQGLVNPERSPSGYRKFYDHDVERLRWVLRQQREHFLPLKVIRDRLANEEGTADAPGALGETVAVMDTSANGSLEAAAPSPDRGVVATAARAAAASGSTPGSRPGGVGLVTGGPPPGPSMTSRPGPGANGEPSGQAEPPERPAQPGAPVTGAGGGAGPSGGPGAGSGRPPLTRLVGDVVPAGPARAGSPGASQRQAPGVAPTPPAPSPGGSARPGPGTHQASPVPRPRHEVPDEPTGSRSPAVGSAPEPGSGEPVAREPLPKAPSGHQSPAEAPTPRTAPPRPQDGGQASAAPSQRAPVPPGGAPDRPGFPAAPGVSGVSLTADELSGASGLSATEVAALEGFGLVEPMTVAGVLYYDEEALTVAKLVAEFARYGIEPRHLRLYRNAVDREVGLIEQIITPLLRQRNPESRQRAVDSATDLATLGQNLRASLLRRELRRQFGS